MTTQPEPTASTLDHLVDDLAAALADPEHELGLTPEQAEAAATFGVHWLDGANHLAVDPIVTRHATGYLAVDWPNGGNTARIAREALDEITAQLNELNTLRLLLGLQPGQTLCGAVKRGESLWTQTERTCLLQSGHSYTTGGPSRHRGLCGSWTA